MSKIEVFKITICVVNHDRLGLRHIIDEIENVSYSNNCISPRVVSPVISDTVEWSDEHPLNSMSASVWVAEFKRIFGDT